MPKAKRAGRRRGNIRELELGRWEVTAPTGKDPLTGKYGRVSRVVRCTKAVDAEKALTALLTEVDGGEHSNVVVSDSTYESLVTRWLEQKRSEGLSPSSLSSYRHASNHLVAHFGDRRPKDVTTEALEALYGRLVQNGLTGATIRKVHQVARGVGDMALRYNLLTVNPAHDAHPPKVETANTGAPENDQIKKLIIEAESRDSVLGPMFRLGTATGARRGELIALRWTDVLPHGITIRRAIVLDGSELVERQTKTGKIRTVSIDDATVAALDAHRDRCDAACKQAGGKRDPNGFVFSPQPDGSVAYRPDSVTGWFSKLAKKKKIKTTWYQATRHWHASVCVAAGLDLRTVADRLGHDPRVLLAKYSHLRPGKDQEAADFVGALLST